jgi:GNAT superfamily N-acetyltransferase
MVTVEGWKRHIRTARPLDIAECVRLRGLTRENAVSAERLASLGITVESWADQVASGELIGVVSESAGEMQGYCFGDRGSGEIVVLALLPQAEGRGLGKELLSQVVNALRAHGHSRLFLGCSRDPASRSHGFYRHLGWRPTGEFDDHEDELLELVSTTGHA